MEFLNTAAFWGLTVLLVPTIVLLLSKKKQNIVNFPSLEFLLASESKSARSLFPTEWFVWVLRVAAISLLVFLLARPIFESQSHGKKIYIEKEVHQDPSFQSVLSSLDHDVEVIDPESLWILVSKLNSNPDSSVVYTRNYAKGFKGRPIELASHVDWKIVPRREALKLLDTFLLADGAFETEITSGEDGLKWKSEKLETTSDVAPEIIKINIISAASKQGEKEKLKSILNAYSELLPLAFNFDAEAPEWNILIDTSLLSNDSKVLQWEFIHGELSLNNVSRDYVEMQGELSKQNLEGSDFALQLAHVFFKDQMNLTKLDGRLHSIPLHSKHEVVNASIGKSERKYYWWSIILILILIERWYSHKLAGT